MRGTKYASTHRCWNVSQTGPQREVFAGGTKIDAGPPKFSEALNQKRSSLKFGPDFWPKLGEEQKKKNVVITQIWF